MCAPLEGHLKVKRPWRAAATAAVVIAAASLGFACGDDEGNEEDIAAVRAAIAANLEADEAADAEAYLATVTDDFLENVYGAFGANEQTIREAPEEFLGNPAQVDANTIDIEVDGDTATAIVSDMAEGASGVSWVKSTLVKEDDQWLLDRIEPTDDPAAPEDAQEVDVSMEDFAFSFDEDDFETGKSTVLQLSNDGDQPHFVIFAKIPDNANLEQLLQSEDEPEGVTTLADSFIFLPGQTGEVTIEEPLQAGRYVMLCFISDPPDDPEGVPHAFKGMQADFRID
jgi:ketosteroid isomerase-like protein